MEVIWLNRNPVLNLKRGLSFRRQINSWLMGAQMKLGMAKLWGYPRHVILDLVNVCGLQCPICPQGQKKINRNPTQISEELFKQIMDTLGPYLYTLTLTNWGEPLRHPKLGVLLQYTRKFPCYTGFSTNLQYLPDELLNEILRSGIDEIGCSIDGVTEQTYSKYRVGGDFDTAFNNMIRLIKTRNTLGLVKPKIRWQVLLTRHTECEIDQIKQKAEEIGVDSLVFLPIFVDIARMFTHSPKERLKNDNDWLPQNPELSWYDYTTGCLKNAPQLCSKLWDTMVIHPDGRISPCCAVMDKKDDFAEMFNADNFHSIWNNSHYQLARKRIARKTSQPVHSVCECCYRNGVLIF